MTTVGIIANPVSGKDIRRIVSKALVVSNHDKANIVARMLVGLNSAGVDRVLIMPDKFGLGQLAINTIERNMPQVTSGVEILEMDFIGTGIDTIRAVRFMRQAGAGCIIAVGGDGTARLASKEIGDLPLLPVSTGTNNVLPQFVEGTIAGLAAGLIAQMEPAMRATMCYRSKRLVVLIDGQPVDYGLVDIAAVAGGFSGSRAVWESDSLRQVAVTRASPASIGLSTIVGMIRPITPQDRFGGAVTIEPTGSGKQLSAPIGPGLITQIPVGKVVLLQPGECYPVTSERPLVLAIDGERERPVKPGEQAALCLQLDGPWIVMVDRVLERAVQEGYFIRCPASQ